MQKQNLYMSFNAPGNRLFKENNMIDANNALALDRPV